MMKSGIWVCSFLLIGITSAVAQEFDSARLERITPVLQKFVDDKQIAGAVTLIASPERVVHVTTVGQADIASNRPMRDDTLFRIASMTKLITATALMQLAEQRNLPVSTIRSRNTSRPFTSRELTKNRSRGPSPCAMSSRTPRG